MLMLSSCAQLLKTLLLEDCILNFALCLMHGNIMLMEVVLNPSMLHYGFPLILTAFKTSHTSINVYWGTSLGQVLKGIGWGF